MIISPLAPVKFTGHRQQTPWRDKLNPALQSTYDQWLSNKQDRVLKVHAILAQKNQLNTALENQLHRSGLTITDKLLAFGFIFGTINISHLPRLAKIKNIISINEEGPTVDIETLLDK